MPDSLDGVAASHWLRYCCYRSPPFSCPHPESLMLARSFLSFPSHFILCHCPLPCKKFLLKLKAGRALRPWWQLSHGIADIKRNPRLADEADGEQPNTETQIAVDASRQQLLPVRCYMRACGGHLAGEYIRGSIVFAGLVT